MQQVYLFRKSDRECVVCSSDMPIKTSVEGKREGLFYCQEEKFGEYYPVLCQEENCRAKVATLVMDLDDFEPVMLDCGREFGRELANRRKCNFIDLSESRSED
ncbi:MAG: hypothetical protein WC533_03745 [Candidatus Pacearchaeota archaeon]